MANNNLGKILSLILITAFFIWGCRVKDKNQETGEPVAGPDQGSAEQEAMVAVDGRYIAIDNVCAWPNLTVLEDGTIVATIFNQPSHARSEGDVECWGSKDGRFWGKLGTPAAHDPGTNRMNVAAGLAGNGQLVVIASGWSLGPAAGPDGRPSLIDVLRPWVSRSSDGGVTWSVNKQGFPKSEPGMTEFIPFGDIIPGADGSLRVLAYAQSRDKEINKVSMFRSEDDGLNWKQMSVISDGKMASNQGHNETAFFHLGEGKWIAAARRWKLDQAMDLFRSDDDGETWQPDRQITEGRQHPGHLLQLNDGSLLLTSGNRTSGQFGVAAKTSNDGGVTWSDQILVIKDLPLRDVGYPASVQLPDGKILTAYYAVQAPSHQRYHMGVVLWDL